MSANADISLEPSPPAVVRMLAHVRQDETGEWREHLLEEHLRGVAERAAAFAAKFGSGPWAWLAGLWHDLGKYRPAFQAYIRGASGYQADAHLEGQGGRVDHSTAGAILAAQRFGIAGRVLAYLIAGHHAGLADWRSDTPGTRNLADRLQQTGLLDDVLRQNLPDDIRNARLSGDKPPRGSDPALWIRMLFSCVVDADFLDTEAFMDQRAAAQRGIYPPLSELAERLDAFLDELQRNAPDTSVNRIRAEILRQCRLRSADAPGLFSCTVPTGGGKTLSLTAFAMCHALAHGKRRVIYVIPYTSIIEQTADVLRGIFGESVLEHHSNLDADRETPRSRLAAENWDAPIIVTTSAQFFESLFAARTSRVRKLHNIVDSVVILDEAQLLPPDFLEPILATLRQLVAHYGVSAVLSTATQPALSPQESFDWKFGGLEGVREIMPDPLALHAQLKRVQLQLPADLNQSTDWETLAAELAGHEQVLCIVDRRDDCQTLHRLMPKGSFHLSGFMCGQHRSEVIAEIKQALRSGKPVRVVSTQLVEAGVDLDFPVVYRALAGLDSIAQAAGRCNREGRLPQPGRMVVFVPQRPAPVGHLRQAQQCGRQILQQGHADPLSPEHFEAYFRQLYWSKGQQGLDRHAIQEALRPDRELRFLFRTAADRFRIIDESQQAPVIVRYGAGPDLIDTLERHGPERWLLRKLQRYVVNLPCFRHRQLLENGDIREVHPGIYAQAHDGLYDAVLGLIGQDNTGYEPEFLIV